MACVYCGRAGPFTDEHILARALAGAGEDWVLRDLVCARCNGLFSGYERALTSAPHVAMARIFQGPAGRTRKGQAFQAHPSENVFLTAEDDPIAYEVDLLPGIAPRYRAQLIGTSDAVLPVASTVDDLKRFSAAYKAFVETPEVTLQKRTRLGRTQFRVALLSLAEPARIEKIEWRAKPAAAWRDRFPSEFAFSPDPRLSIDAFGRLRFRVRRLKDIPRFLDRVFAAGNVTSQGGTLEAGRYQIAVRSTYEIPKVHRAIAKTLVNYAIDEFGPAWIAHPNFRPILDYCLGGPDAAEAGPFVGLIEGAIGIEAIDSAPMERHALALASDGVRIVGAIKLYGHFLYRVHLGRAPPGTLPFTRSVQIDFLGGGRVGR